MEKCEIDGVVGGGDCVFVVFVCGVWVWTSCLGEVCWARMNECCSLKRWNELLTITKMRNERGAGMHPCVIIMMMENDSKAREREHRNRRIITDRLPTTLLPTSPPPTTPSPQSPPPNPQTCPPPTSPSSQTLPNSFSTTPHPLPP